MQNLRVKLPSYAYLLMRVRFVIVVADVGPKAAQHLFEKYAFCSAGYTALRLIGIARYV